MARDPERRACPPSRHRSPGKMYKSSGVALCHDRRRATHTLVIVPARLPEQTQTAGTPARTARRAASIFACMPPRPRVLFGPNSSDSSCPSTKTSITCAQQFQPPEAFAFRKVRPHSSSKEDVLATHGKRPTWASGSEGGMSYTPSTSRGKAVVVTEGIIRSVSCRVRRPSGLSRSHDAFHPEAANHEQHRTSVGRNGVVLIHDGNDSMAEQGLQGRREVLLAILGLKVRLRQQKLRGRGVQLVEQILVDAHQVRLPPGFNRKHGSLQPLIASRSRNRSANTPFYSRDPPGQRRQTRGCTTCPASPARRRWSGAAGPAPTCPGCPGAG
eukprot:scaffold1340_cov253-Pinguiococcus_pyrenoidosus.AAC.41